jgi:mannosyltransferase OCH1-like enzyme
MKDFISESSNLKNMFDIIFVLLLGNEDNVDIAGLLLNITKEKKSNTLTIFNLLNKRLGFGLQTKIKKSNNTIKQEIDRLKSLTLEDVDYKKQLLANKNIPDNVKSLTLNGVPAVIYQTSETKRVTNTIKSIIDENLKNNSEFDYYFYDDDDCLEFIEDNFDEDVVYAYKQLIPGAYKADLWRYCILYINGGFYADIDTLCLDSIDKILDKHVEFVSVIDLNATVSEGNHNLSNGFIGSIPKHPILFKCIMQIVNHVQNNIIGRPAFRTIPMYSENAERSLKIMKERTMTYIIAGISNKKPFLMVDCVGTDKSSGERKFNYTKKLERLISTKEQTYFCLSGSDCYSFAISIFDRECYEKNKSFDFKNEEHMLEIIEIFKYSA